MSAGDLPSPGGGVGDGGSAMMGQGYVSGVVNPPPTPSLEGGGLSVASEGAFGVQYHPEASPGPQDSFYLFEKFVGGLG